YCVLELLWLSEESRGKGLGSKLIKQLVEFATEKGLSQIRTETLDFQAKPFYEKQGFRVYGELEDTPKGHKTYFLVKAL
ncbi:GNAT family N-acetyltransferase, partial [Vibrio parahaemolyticus]